jgi:hypothetical protein
MTPVWLLGSAPQQMQQRHIANCFAAIPHSGLLQAIKERVGDRAVLDLVRGMPPLTAMPRVAAARQGRVRVQAAHSAAWIRRHLAWAADRWLPSGSPLDEPDITRERWSPDLVTRYR